MIFVPGGFGGKRSLACPQHRSLFEGGRNQVPSKCLVRGREGTFLCWGGGWREIKRRTNEHGNHLVGSAMINRNANRGVEHRTRLRGSGRLVSPTRAFLLGCLFVDGRSGRKSTAPRFHINIYIYIYIHKYYTAGVRVTLANILLRCLSGLNIQVRNDAKHGEHGGQPHKVNTAREMTSQSGAAE